MFKGHAAMLLFSALVSVSFILGNLTANLIAPQAITAARFGVAVAAMLAVVALRGEWQRAHMVAPWRYLLPGGCFAIYFALMFEALKTAPPVNLAVIFTLTPLFSGVADRLFNKRGIRPIVALALLLGAVGAVWVIFEGDMARLLRLQLGRGEAVFALAVLIHAIYPAAMPWISRGEPAASVSLLSLIAGALIICAVGAPAIANTDWSALPPIVWGTIGYLGIFATAISFLCVKYASTILPSAKVMAYTYLVPFWVALGAGFTFGTWPAPHTWLGGTLIAAALLTLLFDHSGTERSEP